MVKERTALQIKSHNGSCPNLIRVNYYCAFWDGLSVTLNDELELQYRASRVITRLRYNTKASFLLNRTHWENLSTL